MPVMHGLVLRWFPSAGETFYIVEWAVRLLALAILPWRRSPAAVRSWLLLIFFLPVPGLLLFLLIGRPRFPRWRHDRFRALDPVVERVAAGLDGAAPADLGGTEREIAGLARTLGRMPAVAGNGAELLDDYDGVVDRLVADIDAARSHVRLLAYIFADDAVGRRVADALARARGRGVAVHVLFDPVGSHRWRRGTWRLLAAAGAEVREALPFRLLRGRTRRDMRNHRKLFLVDGRVGYAGSQNIVAKDFRPGVVNHELVLRATGPIVAELEALFVADWFLETEELLPLPPVPPATGDAVLQMLPSGADYPLEGFETLLTWQLHRACTRVVLVTPYFIPDDALLGAMRTAVVRGVEVDLVVSAVVDQRLVNLAQSSYYDELMEAGIRIHRFRDELLHAKNVAVDGRLGICGSSNVDVRSFQLNEEVSLLLLDRAGIAALEAVQAGYLARSDRLELDAWRRRGRLRRMAEAIARLVSPLL